MFRDVHVVLPFRIKVFSIDHHHVGLGHLVRRGLDLLVLALVVLGRDRVWDGCPLKMGHVVLIMAEPNRKLRCAGQHKAALADTELVTHL